MIKNLNFWLKFNRLFFVLLCAFILGLGGSQMHLASVHADEENYDEIGDANPGEPVYSEPLPDENGDGSANPGEPVYSEPLPQEEPVDYNPGPNVPVQGPPVQGPPVQGPTVSAPTPSCSDDVTYCDNGSSIHKHGGYWDGSQCVYAFNNEGSCGASAPTAHSCNEDVTYCDASTHTNIHKTGGYWDGSQCVYAFNNTGQSCGASAPTCSENVTYCDAGTHTNIHKHGGYWNGSQCVYAFDNTNQACGVQQIVQAPPVVINQPTQPTPPVVITAPIVPTVPATNIVNNNTNTNTNSQTQTVTVSVPQSFGNVGVAQTQVLGVKELPKTGLPMLAYTALAFLPAGFGMRKFSKVKGALSDSATFIWEDRQYKSES